MRNSVRVLIGVLGFALLAAACSGGDDEGETTTTMAESWTTAGATTTMPAGLLAPGTPWSDEASGDGTDAEAVVAVLQTGRSIIFTANLEIEVDDVVTAGEQAQAAVAGLGGVLFGQETTTGPEPRSVLTIKVPPENFGEALRRLAGIGQLVSQSIFADDVTERVVDLQSRVTTAEASVERLRTFLEGATDLEGVAALERELLQRETDLEVMRGQLRTLEDQVALATIVLVLTEPAPGPAVELVGTAYFGHDGGTGCPGNEELAIDESEPFTVCYEVTNSGDTLLGDIEVRDSGLEARPEDLLVVEGDLATPLPPGGRLILAFEAEADPDRWTGPEVTATALDADGNPLWQQVEATKLEAVALQVARDDSLPGFGDALSGAWHALQRLGGVAVVVGGALLPFLWVPALVVAVWWWLRRRRLGAAERRQGPPPAPPGEPTGN